MLYPEINFNIKRQDFYSRMLLLMRYFFGWFYIGVPHGFLLFFYFIYISVIRFVAFWVTLITGEYPHFAYESNIQYLHWTLRVKASINHLTDEYPTFGMHKISNSVTLEVEYPQNISRLSVLVRATFGFLYCVAPHALILFFRFFIIGFIQIFIALIVLITGQFPKDIFQFIEGTLLWDMRVKLYLLYLTQKYPVFSSAK